MHNLFGYEDPMTIWGARLPISATFSFDTCLCFSALDKTWLFPYSSSYFIWLSSHHPIGRVRQLSLGGVVCQRANVKGCMVSMVEWTEPMSRDAWLTLLVFTANKTDKSFALRPTFCINLIVAPYSSYPSCCYPLFLESVLL